jgi:hypothetical protein
MTNDTGAGGISVARLVVIAAIAVVVVVIVMAVQSWRLQSARRQVVNMALAADSVEASRDTTRRIYMTAVVAAAARSALVGSVGTGDSLRVVQRRVVQAVQRADALDRALRLERVARQRLEIAISGLRERSAKAPVEGANSDSVRRAVFDVRRAPYSVHAEVALPRAPELGRMDVRVDLDTIRLEARIGCGSAPAGLRSASMSLVAAAGLRSASMSLVAPAWASVALAHVEQSPNVCGGVLDGARTAAKFWRRVLDRFGLTVGYGAVRGSSGVVAAGVGVSAGFKVWP